MKTPQEQADHDRFLKVQADILGGLPPEFHGPIAAIAWDIGHAYGYFEVIGHLKDFAEQFERPIKDFTKRLLTPSSQ